MNPFTMAVILLFLLAGIVEIAQGNPAKASFYWLSAAINVNVIFMR